jgi:hypothetical protein
MTNGQLEAFIQRLGSTRGHFLRSFRRTREEDIAAILQSPKGWLLQNLSEADLERYNDSDPRWIEALEGNG